MPLQPIDREVVLNVVRTKGPCIPNDIKQQLKLGDTILLGAMLSEMASKGHVKISHVKKGGSPYYYDPEKPEQLEKAAESLNEKDRRTYALLKERKVLRDDEHEALTRVSLRNIKDYAVPFEMHNVDGDILFWKYFLVPELEARRLAFGEPPVQTPTPPVQIQPPAPVYAQAPQAQTSSTQEVISPQTPPITAPSAPPSPPPEAPKKRTRKAAEPKPKAEKSGSAAETQRSLAPAETQASPASLLSPLPPDDFTDQVLKFFGDGNIKVLEQRPIKKGELDFVVVVPSPVGDVTYFCKARSKKSSSDGDLASAKLQGMSRGLPTVYLTDGELAKRAKEMLANELKGLVVKRL